jgi:MraZ protein
MFYGEYHHSIDKKGRIIIPSQFREVMKTHFIERLYVTRGLDRCLFIFPEDEWRKQEQNFKSMSFTKKDAREFTRLFFSGAYEASADVQGRVLLPQNLKQYAQIERDIVVIGVSSRMEIWARKNWEEFARTVKDSYEQIAEKIL